MVYLLGCGKDWCLMCELEKHVLMLRESGGALSPRQILFHMRSINCQIGDGSQEDAHEFLRSVKICHFYIWYSIHCHLHLFPHTINVGFQIKILNFQIFIKEWCSV
jgi:hypothetical protein